MEAERNLPPGYTPPSPIVWSELLEQMLVVSNDLRIALEKLEILRFPDGSAYIPDTASVFAFHQILMPYRAKLKIRENTQFRTLKCFESQQPKRFALLITDRYFQRIGGEQSLLISPASRAQDPNPRENCGSQLPVKVTFWGGLPEDVRSPFFKAIISWGDSVGVGGLFGEGPAYIFPESFTFSRRSASFLLDVRCSGQHTINWLSLSILNFASRTALVSRISYGESEES